jgi:hypothetical protein
MSTIPLFTQTDFKTEFSNHFENDQKKIPFFQKDPFFTKKKKEVCQHVLPSGK